MLYFFHHFELPVIMQQAQLQQLLLNQSQNPPNSGPRTDNESPNPGAAPTAADPNDSTQNQQPPIQSQISPQNAATNERYALLRQRIFHARLGAQAIARIHDRNNNPPHYFLPSAVHRLFAHIGSFVGIPTYLRRTLNVFGALRNNMAHNLIHLTQNQTRLDNLRRITLNSIEIRPVNMTVTESVSHTVAPSSAIENTIQQNVSENNYGVEATSAEPNTSGHRFQENLVPDGQLIEHEQQPVPVSNVDDIVNLMVVDDEATKQPKTPPHTGPFSNNTIHSCGASSLSDRTLSAGSSSTSSTVTAASK